MPNNYRNNAHDARSVGGEAAFRQSDLREHGLETYLQHQIQSNKHTVFVAECQPADRPSILSCQITFGNHRKPFVSKSFQAHVQIVNHQGHRGAAQWAV